MKTIVKLNPANYVISEVFMKRLLFILLLSSISFVFGTLVSPSDGDELNYIHILFEWEQQPDAIGYNLQVSTDEFFNNLILDVDETYTVYIPTNICDNCKNVIKFIITFGTYTL